MFLNVPCPNKIKFHVIDRDLLLKTVMRVLAVVVLVISATNSGSGQIDGLEAELARLREAFNNEQDRDKRDALNKQMAALWRQLETEKSKSLHEQ